MDPSRLHPSELAAIAGAVTKRRQEFAAGRLLARRLMPWHDGPLLNDARKAPRWPDGIRGSITHCARLAAVAIGSDDDFDGIGIDVEANAPLPAGVVELVTTPVERAYLARLPARRRTATERLIFSAKESVYKCQYASTEQFLDFGDVDVELAAEPGRFLATLRRDVSPYQKGSIFDGRYRVTTSFICTAVFVRRA